MNSLQQKVHQRLSEILGKLEYKGWVTIPIKPFRLRNYTLSQLLMAMNILRDKRKDLIFYYASYPDPDNKKGIFVINQETSVIGFDLTKSVLEQEDLEKIYEVIK